MRRCVERIEADIELHLKTSAYCISQKMESIVDCNYFQICSRFKKQRKSEKFSKPKSKLPISEAHSSHQIFSWAFKHCYPTHWSPTWLLVIFLVNVDNNCCVKLNAETMMRSMSWEIKTGRAQPWMRIQNQRVRTWGQHMKLSKTKMMKNCLPQWVLPRAYVQEAYMASSLARTLMNKAAWLCT